MTLRTFFDFCSGIGGGRLGLEQLGLKSVGYADTARISPITYKLMHDTSDEKNYGNVKRVNGQELPRFDIFIAGFPCQSFSVIGRKDGFNDHRGQIIFHLSRIINEHRPKCFLLENVKGLVTHDKGKTLDIILDDLKSNGYNVFFNIISSFNFGVPQMRERIYIVGFEEKLGINDFIWPEPYGSPSLNNFLIDEKKADLERVQILDYYLNNDTNDNIYTIEELKKLEGSILDTRMNDLRIYDYLCPTLRTQRDGILYVKNQEIYQLSGYEALLLQGFPKEYADRVKDKVSNRHLLMQAGNSMTVPVIRAIGEQIIKTVEGEVMLVRGSKFEQDSIEYLNNNYTNNQVEFIHHGGMDSTLPDIEVKISQQHAFYIEAKMANAQSGQFVVVPHGSKKEFYFSPRNKTEQNEITETIIDYMNEDFEIFLNAGTSGEYIFLDSHIFSKWIIDYYKSKNIKYIISWLNGYVILPIEKYGDYFKITAKYREKRSGTNSLARIHHENAKAAISGLYSDSVFSTDERNRLFVSINSPIASNYIDLGDFTLYLSQVNSNTYQVKRRSNTTNLNVIFSIQLIQDQIEEDLYDFKNEFI